MEEIQMKKLLVILAIVGLAVTFAGTTMAAEWNFYGNARMATYYISTEDKQGGAAEPVTGLPIGEQNANVIWDLQGNSRIGAKVKHGDISGYFEYGAGDVQVRKLYGTWDFGAGKLLVGQTYTPSTFFYAGQAAFADDGFFLLGQPYAGRKGMVALEFAGDWGLFKAATIKNDGGDTFGLASADVENYIPKFEVSYSYKADMWFLDAAGGYQYYSVEDTTPIVSGGTGFDEDVSSYLLGAGGGVNFGGFYAKLFGFFGQNLDQYGMGAAGFDGSGFSGGLMLGQSGAQINTNPITGLQSFEDTTSYGGLVVLGYKLNDMVTLEGGISMNIHDTDADFSNEINPVTNLPYEYDDDKAYGFYVQAPLTLADGVFLVPEFGYYDLDDTNLKDVEEGDRWYLGAKWQINF
jgi:hypothetical protein